MHCWVIFARNMVHIVKGGWCHRMTPSFVKNVFHRPKSRVHFLLPKRSYRPVVVSTKIFVNCSPLEIMGVKWPNLMVGMFLSNGLVLQPPIFHQNDSLPLTPPGSGKLWCSVRCPRAWWMDGGRVFSWDSANAMTDPWNNCMFTCTIYGRNLVFCHKMGSQEHLSWKWKMFSYSLKVTYLGP